MDSPAPRCATCPFRTGRAGGAHCSIREAAIDAPEQCFCANHPTLAGEPDPTPVGPVMRCGPNESSVVHASPDSERVRRHLLDIVERTKARTRSELTVREATAIWQLQAFRERRAHVYVDRLAAGGSAAHGHGSAPVFALPQALFQKISGEDVSPPDPRIPILERLTIAGRALLLATIVIGVLAFFALLELLYENAPTGMRLPVTTLILIAILAACAFLACGVFALRRLGIAFLVAEKAAERPPRNAAAGDHE
jgi:hypothetical protein